ncbi:EamA family transporter [Filobacillus milosensis]|uniref:EamA family transporter n=1 Tax=Filobacillus milosensis TaxID=94137 RepID=A0A4Y8IQ51_9BACI|nr:DMT family transporter [Filobacillus milosensis]TFB22823.1 EamA family transporter [Filobacillus milosensis]
MRMNHTIAYAMVVLGASLWGIQGLFVQNLYSYGLTPWQVVTVRLTISSLILLIILGTLARSYLKIRLIDLPYFIGLGILSIAFFNWFYFQVMDLASLSVAVVFVYTSPIFAAIIAKILFKETLTTAKIISILLTIIGSALAIEFIPLGESSLTILTVIFGLLAGFFCATYSLIGKNVSQWYHPFTITFYSVFCGSLFLIPTSQIWEHGDVLLEGGIWGNILGLAIFSTVIAYMLYTIGLTFIESSKATILASVEIIIAVLVGVVVLGEVLTVWQLLGFVFVFLSLFLTVFSFKPQLKKGQFNPSKGR